MHPAIEMVAGGALLLLVVADALMTTLTVSAGAGPVARFVSGVCWRVLLRVHRPDRSSSFLSGAGAALLVLTVLLWVAGLWAGWTLVFHGSGVVVDSTTRGAATLVDTAYFSGMTVFTLGTGDFVAATPMWRAASAVASFSGLFLVTLAITYLVSVVSAVVGRRSLATQVHGLGATHAEQHLAYPVLHYFHADRRGLSAPVALAALDDALLVMAAGVRTECRPDQSAVVPLRSSIERYLTTASRIAWVPEAAVPPAPGRPVESAGIPLGPEAEWEAAVARAGGRRRQLHQLVVSDGWSWSG